MVTDDATRRGGNGAARVLRKRRAWRPLIAVYFALALSACPGGVERPDRIVSPDAIGIVEDVESSEDGVTKTLRLDNREEVVVHNTRDIEITGNANEGFLLVSGTIGGARWNMFLRRDDDITSSACYSIGIRPFDDGEHVVVPAGLPDNPFGIRLRKAPGFNADPHNRETGRYGSTGSAQSFCLNEEGQVTGQADLLRRESE